MFAPGWTGPWEIPAHSLDTMLNGWIPPIQGFNGSVAWGTANRAIYVPLRVPTRVIVRKLAAASNTTGSSNIDIGLYDAGGTRLVSNGAAAKAASLEMKVFDVTDTTIGPGQYYLALNSAGTTDTFMTFNTAQAPMPAAFGVLTQAVGATALPNPATWAVDQTLAFIPLISALLVTEVS